MGRRAARAARCEPDGSGREDHVLIRLCCNSRRDLGVISARSRRDLGTHERANDGRKLLLAEDAVAVDIPM